MDSILYLAYRYVVYHRFKSIILVLCVTFAIFLPISGKAVLDNLQAELRSRAQQTPYVIGAKGSQFDLALHALYLDVDPPATFGYNHFRMVRENRPGTLVPLYRTHTVQGDKPVVGTDLYYFEYRQLELAEGHLFQRIGHCVIGADVASQLEVGLGDALISKPQNDVNLAGATPVKMEIVGILQPTGTADDNAVFTDIKTTWVIDGLGHGHEDVETVHDPNLFLDRDERSATVNQGVLPYIEITDENVHTFHFHGDPDDFPLTAILLFPKSEKAATMLQGAIDNAPEAPLQMITPDDVIDQLVDRILKVKSLFDLATLTIVLITALFLVLNTALSIRLRQREMLTMYKIGCSRFVIFGLYFWEYLIILLTSLALALAMAFAVNAILQDWVVRIIR